MGKKWHWIGWIVAFLIFAPFSSSAHSEVQLRLGDALRQKLSPLEIAKIYEANLIKMKEERRARLFYGTDAAPVPVATKATISGGVEFEGNHYLPIRPIVEALGGALEWDADEKAAIVQWNDRRATLRPGTEPGTSDAFIQDGATLVATDWLRDFAPEATIRSAFNLTTVSVPLAELTIVVAPFAPEEPDKIAYLTFDDGPSHLTEQILDILKEHDIRATFFPVGKNVAKRESIVRRIVEEGHSLGGHTFTHDYMKIYRSPEAFFADLEEGYDAIERATGVRPTFFRFPGGSNNLVSKRAQDAALYAENEWIMLDLVRLARERGERYFDWNVTNGDASGGSYTARDAFEKVKEGLQGRDQVVILCHDSAGKAETVKSLPRVIEHLKEEGYAFRALDASAPAFSFLR